MQQPNGVICSFEAFQERYFGLREISEKHNLNGEGVQHIHCVDEA